jgi:hypothetical protein
VNQRYSAVFDGRNFCPVGPVDVEPGTAVEVIVVSRPGTPHPDAVTRPLTESEERAWAAIRSAAPTAPDPPTFEEYLREGREGL